MPKLHLDFETRSKADLTVIGSYNYSRHRSTSVLCCAFALDDEPIKLIPFEDFDNAYIGNYSSTLEELYDYANTRDITFNAHNAMFERCMWNHLLARYCGAPRISLTRWRCTMAKGAYHSLPKSLDNLARALNIGHKFADGKKAMMRLTKPKEPSKVDPSIWVSDPEKFRLMYDYCVGDVELERNIDNSLPDLPQREQRIWFFDQRMNERGIPIDVETVALVQERFEIFMDKGRAEFEELTGGLGVKQNAKLKEWLRNEGLLCESVDAAHVTEMLLDDELLPRVRRMLELKQLLGATTSITKLSSMLTYACPEDHRVRGAFVYSSGITHRWGGAGIQPQNMPRITDEKEMDVFEEILNTRNIDAITSIEQIKKGLRAFIKCEVGTKLLVGDLAQIEARVVMWLAKEEKGLVKFRNKEDIYLDLAKQIYHNEELSKKDKEERQLGKMGILGCGFQMGASKFQAQAKTQWSMTLETELAERVVKTYRGYYTKVVEFWYDQENAAIEAMESGNTIPTPQGMIWRKELIGEGQYKYLTCQLPSGNKLYYYKPWLTQEPFFNKTKTTLNYFKVDPQSGRSVPDKTYGGKIVENIVQAVARDIMASSMLRIVKFNKSMGKQYNVIMTVHDEQVAKVPDNDDYTEEEFLQLLITREKWFETCPVEAEVKTCYRYTK